MKFNSQQLVCIDGTWTESFHLVAVDYKHVLQGWKTQSKIP